MPYIKSDDRQRIVVPVDDYKELAVIAHQIKNPGELNFAISLLLSVYFSGNGGRYQQVNDILGALEGAKLEFYRRVAAPYEDKKIIENGEVYV